MSGEIERPDLDYSDGGQAEWGWDDPLGCAYCDCPETCAMQGCWRGTVTEMSE